MAIWKAVAVGDQSMVARYETSRDGVGRFSEMRYASSLAVFSWMIVAS